MNHLFIGSQCAFDSIFLWTDLQNSLGYGVKIYYWAMESKFKSISNWLRISFPRFFGPFFWEVVSETAIHNTTKWALGNERIGMLGRGKGRLLPIPICQFSHNHQQSQHSPKRSNSEDSEFEETTKMEENDYLLLTIQVFYYPEGRLQWWISSSRPQSLPLSSRRLLLPDRLFLCLLNWDKWRSRF